MSYKSVHYGFHNTQPHIPRNAVRDAVLSDVGANRVKWVCTGMDVKKCRGFFLHATNHLHPLVMQFGTHIIVTARGMNRCWTRFVFVKELMHFFDGSVEATDSGEQFESALGTLTGPGSPNLSPQAISEIRAFWMALGILCPEHTRLKMQAARQAGHLTDYQIALQLKIPEQYVHRLFSPLFDGIVHPLIK